MREPKPFLPRQLFTSIMIVIIGYLPYDFYKNRNFNKINVSLIAILIILLIFHIPVIGGCQYPNYLCCDGDEYRIQFTCDNCEDCCDTKDAVLKDGTPTKCPTYCNCEGIPEGERNHLFYTHSTPFTPTKKSWWLERNNKSI